MMRWFRRLLALLFVAALAFAGWMGHFAVTPLPLRASSLDFHIKAGSSLRAAAGQMADSGVPLRPWQFTVFARLLGKAGEIKAGSYEIRDGVTPRDLLEKLTRGDVTQAEIVFIEGWSFRQLRAALDAHPALVHDTAGLSEGQILEKLGAEGPAEGGFYPDTYLFARGSSDLHVLRRAHRAMQQILAAEWASRDAHLPYASPYEALIMASIVEKETGQARDRSLIAAVFVNRLRKGMLLQTDPSVIYGLGERFDGNLRKQDLATDGPYNTYTRPGLPPTPIALPGLASIQASLHPAGSDMLYFVARGDGSSHFSGNLDEHNRAVAKYQKKRAN